VIGRNPPIICEMSNFEKIKRPNPFGEDGRKETVKNINSEKYSVYESTVQKMMKSPQKIQPVDCIENEMKEAVLEKPYVCNDIRFYFKTN
jgi:hypothetical protein